MAENIALNCRLISYLLGVYKEHLIPGKLRVYVFIASPSHFLYPGAGRYGIASNNYLNN
jgi:hypothetical protein